MLVDACWALSYLCEGSNDKIQAVIEAGVREGWDRYIGSELLDSTNGSGGGAFIGMHSFGASGPYKDVYAKFGITADAAVAAARKLLK